MDYYAAFKLLFGFQVITTMANRVFLLDFVAELRPLLSHNIFIRSSKNPEISASLGYASYVQICLLPYYKVQTQFVHFLLHFALFLPLLLTIDTVHFIKHVDGTHKSGALQYKT